MTADLVVVVAVVLAPGLGAALAFAPPREISIETRAALVFGFGYAIAAGAALLLALAHVFHRPTYIAALVVATGAVWALALRGGSHRAHLSALRAQAREAPFAVAVNLTLLLVVALVWVGQSAVYNLDRRSAWRYWADGLEIAAAGHVPPESRQWGMEIPTTVSKVALNAFEGGLSFFIGPEPLSGMHAILLVAAVGLVAALLALGRELGLGMFSALVPALVVLVPKGLPLGREMSYDLTRYTAENVGRMAAVCALLSAIYALRTERRAPSLIVGVFLAIAALTHAIPTAIACVLLAFYALGAVLVDRGRLRRILARGAVVVAVLAVSYVAVVGLTRGDLGFETAGRGSFADFPANVDPTRSFSQGEYSPPVPTHGHWVTPPNRLVASYATRTFDLPGPAWWSLGAIAALFAATAALVWQNRALLPLGVVAWGWSVFMLAAAFFFSYRYKTQIPGHFGLWRLFDYAVLLPGLLLPAVLAGGMRLLPGVRAIKVAALALVACVLAAVTAIAYVRQDGPTRRAEAGLRVIAQVARVVPCDARMVANGRTAGTWEAMTGRRALTEGRAPFLQSNVLARVLTVLDGATRFFDDPAANQSFLTRERVDYLVVVSRQVWFGSGGTGRQPTAEDADRIAALPDVRPALRNDEVAIFTAGPQAARGTGEPPSRCPL